MDPLLFATSKRSLLDEARDGNLEQIEALLASGADVNQRDADGQTALLIACEEDQPGAVKLLLDAGANASCKREDGYTALHMACEAGATACCAALCRHAAGLHEAMLEDGSFPLSVAGAEGQDDCVGVLLDAGAPIQQRRNDGSTALLLACRRGHVTTAKLLVDAQCDIGLCSDLDTPLYVACFEGHAACVQVLIHACAHLDAMDDHGECALYTACERGETACAEALIAAGCSLELATKDGLRPLHAACYAGRAECARVLLEAKANVHAGDMSALSWALKGGDQRCVDLCAEAGKNNLPTDDASIGNHFIVR